jgi:hypothetical protein
MATAEIGAINPVSNDAEEIIVMQVPYKVSITIEGVCPILFHRWNVDAIEAKANAGKGSKAKKTDDTESYMARNEENEICLPAEYLRMSLVNAAKYKQDPRSPRKSAMDLVRAGIIPLSDLCSTGIKVPDYIDKRRVQVQRNGITRHRPALYPHWRATVELMIVLPQYLSPEFVHDLATQAGQFVGVADFRPTFGRFRVVNFSVVPFES